MSGGGTEMYKHPMIPWGGRMRSSLKLPKEAKGCLNCYAGGTGTPAFRCKELGCAAKLRYNRITDFARGLTQRDVDRQQEVG